MKLTGLISGKAHDPGQQFTRVPRARVALITGLAVIALLGGADATVQASTTPSAAAHVVTATPAAETCTANFSIVDEHHGSPLYSYIPGNGNVNLYFDSSGAATYFCRATRVNSAGDFVGYQWYVKGTSVCLALDASAKSIHEGTAAQCSEGASYTLWQLDATSSSYFLYESEYNSSCIYDDTQRPVTYAGCNASNQFEWLSIP
jgi:hypothetical protein